jgi:AcrR family transcriptional regulator/DNA-binding XRE family transcriptional regulator
MTEQSSRQVDVGDRIRHARHERGYSVRHLAQLVGVSAATVSAIENGHTSVTVDRLASIADALDVDLGSFFRRGTASHWPAGPHGQDWRAFDSLDLDPVLRAAIDTFVRAGYHGTSMRTVAVRADMSVPGLYHHYASKQELLVRILDLAMDDLEWRLAGAAAEGVTALHRIALLVEALALFHTLRADLAFLGASEMRSLEHPDLQRIASRRSTVQHILDHEIDAALRERSTSTQAPRETARAIVSMCTSLPQWFDPRGPTSPRAIAALYADLSMDMLGAERAASVDAG